MHKMENKEQKKIEITFSEIGSKITTSSTMNKDLTVYSIVTALESLSEGLKYKLGWYMEKNNITPDDEDFTTIISEIKISDLQE